MSEPRGGNAYNHFTWAGRRMAGHVRCEWKIQRNYAGNGDLPAGARRGATYKGEQCKAFMPRARADELGAAVCHKHERSWREAVESEREKRRALRNKFDPGPLPVDGE